MNFRLCSFFQSFINLAWKTVLFQTEIEVIRDWFVNIFQPVEKTADLIVTDFKFEQLNHTKQKKAQNGGASPNGAQVNGKSSDRNVAENVGSVIWSLQKKLLFRFFNILYIWLRPPFTVLKKAEVDLLVGGKAKSYSVVIKVLPTDDQERHSSRWESQTSFSNIIFRGENVCLL